MRQFKPLIYLNGLAGLAATRNGAVHHALGSSFGVGPFLLLFTRARLAVDGAGIIGNGRHVFSQSTHHGVSIGALAADQRQRPPKRKVPPFGGTFRVH